MASLIRYKNLYFRNMRRQVNYYMDTGVSIPAPGNFDRWDQLATEYQNGITNPDWKIQVAKAIDATTNYTTRGYKFGSVPSMGQFVTKSNGRSVFSNGTAHHSPPWNSDYVYSYSDPVIDDQALARIKNKLRGRLGEMKAAVPLVELREVRGLIRQTCDLTTSFTKALVDIKRTKGKSVLKYAQDAWLTYSFGVTPLVSDTIAASDVVLNVLSHRAPSRVVLTAKANKTFLYHNRMLPTNELAAGGQFGWDATSVVEYSCRYIAAIDTKFQFGTDYGMLQRFGLGDLGKELPGILWELIPYSWILDYFTTAGAYLDDTFVLPSGSTIYLLQNTRVIDKGYWTDSVKTSPGAAFIGSRPGHGYWENYLFQRNKLSSLPHASLRIRSVDEIGKNAVNKLLNLVSLLKPNTKKR